MPPPPLPIAARLTRIAPSPANATASIQHPTCAQPSPKEPVLTPRASVSESPEPPSPECEVTLMAERAESGSSFDYNLQVPAQLGEASSSDDNSPEPYIVYSEEATPTSFQLPLRKSVGPGVSYSHHHCQSSVRVKLAPTLTLTLTSTLTSTLTLADRLRSDIDSLPFQI
jgi:hypothetical protein